MVRFNFSSSVQQSLGQITQLRKGIQSTKLPVYVVSTENNPTIEEIIFATDADFSEFLDAQSFCKIYAKIVATSDLTVKLKIVSAREHQFILFFYMERLHSLRTNSDRSAKSYILQPMNQRSLSLIQKLPP